MKLEDLVKEVQNMSDEELRERIRSLRRTRTIVKPPPNKKSKGTAKDPFVELAGGLDSMGPEELQALLNMLGGEEK